MKKTWPPLQFIFVGFESNQQGQAASQEQASSSCPVIFQGVCFSSAAAGEATVTRPVVARENLGTFILPPCAADRRKGQLSGGAAACVLLPRKTRWRRIPTERPAPTMPKTRSGAA